MPSRTVTVANVTCQHCTRTIERELGELPGVRRVAAEASSRQVEVEWEAPATWERIRAALAEIGYPAEEAGQE